MATLTVPSDPSQKDLEAPPIATCLVCQEEIFAAELKQTRRITNSSSTRFHQGPLIVPNQCPDCGKEGSTQAYLHAACLERSHTHGQHQHTCMVCKKLFPGVIPSVLTQPVQVDLPPHRLELLEEEPKNCRCGFRPRTARQEMILHVCQWGLISFLLYLLLGWVGKGIAIGMEMYHYHGAEFFYFWTSAQIGGFCLTLICLFLLCLLGKMTTG